MPLRLLRRFLGLLLVLTARLCLDLVGVLPHLAACVSMLCCRVGGIGNEAQRRSLISVACAAGMAAAFSAAWRRLKGGQPQPHPYPRVCLGLCYIEHHGHVTRVYKCHTIICGVEHCRVHDGWGQDSSDP